MQDYNEYFRYLFSFAVGALAQCLMYLNSVNKAKESVKIFVSRGIMQGPSGLRHHDANDC